MRGAGLSLMLALLSQTAAAGDTLRCGDRLVSTEATMAEVLGVCGEPDHRDPWAWWHPGAGTVADVEEWTYNFGPARLLQVLRFRHGRLVAVGTEGYGWAEVPRRPCRPGDLFEGQSEYRLLARCGEPATRESLNVLRPLTLPDGRVVPARLREVHRERWVYDFGPDYLMQAVTLEDGRVVDVDTGARGVRRR